MVKAVGAKNVSTKKLHWGTYPVLEFTGDRPNGSPFFTAWVGINSPDGWALFIDYRVPKGEGHPTKDEQAIWQHLMEDTKATP